MAILSVTVGQAGLTGVKPQINYIVTNDSIATITAAGYLNKAVAEGFSFDNGSFAAVQTKTSPSSTVVNAGWYQIQHSGSNWTLSAISEPGTVTLPTIAGDFAIFSNVNGGLQDLSYSPTNPAKTKVVMANDVTVAGNVPLFTDIVGTIGDSGIVASSLGLITAVVVLPASSITGAFATPALLLPSPGTGKAIMINSVRVVTHVVTPFAGGGAGSIQYGQTVHGGGTLAVDATTPAAEINAVGSQIYSQYGVPATTVNPTSDITATGVYFSNATGAFTGGTGSTVTFNIAYTIIAAVAP